MADLNPLKFQVAIQDEATGQLNKIEQEFQKLKDKTISVKVEGLSDLQNLLSALQHKQVETLGKNVAAGIHDAAKGLQEEAQKAVRASLGQLAQDLVAVKTAIQHDNFSAFSTRIEKCAQAVNTLDAAFKQFHVTIGSDAGMKNFMTGLGEVIRNVRTTMGSLEVSKGGGALSSLANTYARNVERIEDALFRLQEARAKVSNAIKSAEGAGMDSNIISRWRIYLQVLDAYEKKLQNIKADDTLMNGRGWQTNAFGTTFKHLLSNASDFEKAANVFIRAQEKLSAAREKATGMNAGAAAQRSVSLISGQSTQEIRKQIDAIGALYMRIQELSNLTHSRSSFNKQLSFNWNTSKIPEKDLLEVYSQTFSKLRAELKTLKESGYDVSGFKSQLDSLYATYEKFAALQPVDLGKKLGLEHVKGYTGPSSAATDTQWAAMKHQAEVQEVAGEAAKRHQRKLEELTNAFAQHDAQVAKSQRVQEGDNKARQESAAALRKQAQELVKARMEMLRTQSADLGKLLSMGRGALGSEQYDAVRNALRGVREEMRQIEGVMQRMDSYSTRSLFSIGRGTTQDYTPLISNTQKLVAAKEQATQASHQMTAAEQQLAHALNQTSESARGQSQVLSDLKSLATQYLGVWGGQQFLHNIIEIGGQLEMQRLSIGAILQNTSQANELFDKLKSLATQSPFGVVQLDQMTKQLTAYGFKYNELYDMTKRLADISAATGTDVSRLALALGHVRSEAALSGYTLRQFSMANVPLLQKLSEKLGKTTKEIREMTKKKEIGYDDVIGVLKDLTNEGGMFYNMQEVISESVKAKFKNVRDAMDIMYGEMAEGTPGEALKEVANALMEVTRNWKDAATILGTGAAVWGLQRAAMLLYTKTLGTSTATLWANVRAHQVATAENNLFAFSYRNLTAAEKEQIVVGTHNIAGQVRRRIVARLLNVEREKAIALSRKEIISATAVALSEKKVTIETLARSVATGKLSKVEAALIIKNSTLAASEKTLAVQTIRNVRTFGAFSGVINGTAMAVGRLGMALKGLVLSPIMWVMAGLTAVMELWQRNSSEMEKADELGQKIYDRAADGLQRAREMMKETNMTFSVGENKVGLENVGNVNGQISFPDAKSLDDKKLKATIENWTTFIKDYSATPNIMLNAAFATDEAGNAVHSLAEQYQILGENVKVVIDGMKRSKELSNTFAEAVKDADGGVFDDSFITDMKQYEKAWKEHFKLVNKTVSSYRRYADAALFAARNNKTFLEALKGAKKESASTAEQIMFLAENAEKLKDAEDAFTNAWKKESAKDNNGIGSFEGSGMFLTGGINGKYSELREEFNQVADEFEKSMSNWDFKNLDPGQIQALTLTITDSMSEAGLSVDQVRTKVIELCQERWPQIKIDADLVQARAEVNEMQQRLEKLVNPDGKGIGWLIPLKAATNAGEVIEGIIKGYNAAKGFIEQHGISIRAKFGIASDAKIAEWNDDKLKELAKGDELAFGILKELRDSYRIINQATKASKEYGFSLEKPEKKGGGKKNAGGKKNTGGTKAYKDEFAKRWDERIRIMKEAYGWYDKWEKKVGNDAAIAETNAKYADIFAEWRTDKLLPMDFDVSEIADYARYVEKIRDDALKRYQAQNNDKGKNNGQEALRVYRQAVALLNDIKFDNFTRSTEEFKSNLNKVMDDLLRKWEIFNEVRTATGDSDIAAYILGMDETEVSQRNTANATKSLIESNLARMGNAIKVPIQFDINMSDKQIEENVKSALGGTEYQDNIDSIVEALKKWRELQRNVIKGDIQNYAKLIGSSVDYESQVKKIDDELAKAKETNANLVKDGKISQADAYKADDIATAKAEDKKWKLSLQYVTLMNSSLALTQKEVEQGVNVAMEHLQDLLNHNLITAKEFADEMEKLRGIKADWSKNALFGNNNELTNFLKGGLGGLEQYYKGNIKHADMVLADNSATNIQKRQANAEKVQNEKSLEQLQKFQNKLSGVALVSEMVMGAFEGLQQATQSLSEMFDALGNESAANFWSDFSDSIGGISSIFAPVNNLVQSAMSGNVAGMVTSAITAPVQMITGPITAFSQLHDKRIERQIEKLREDVQKIEANTKLIQQARERTLGFDTGELRRSYAQDYAANQTQALKDFLTKYPSWKIFSINQGYSSKGQKSMSEYYSRNSSGTGYQQEYQNLLAQRKDYLEILDKQESKKKKSQSDIEETKSKIAELDDQIRYFTMDLAKELWDIDIKGWADQLSDALSSAFENGESMAKAYKETVTSILQQVMNKMMQLAILEPMFQSLQDKLFGNAEKNISGVFDPNDPKGSMSKVTAMITDFFGKGGEGEKTITAAQEFMTAFQRGVQNAGLSVLNESSNTLSSGVQGTSEETSDLLAGYVNALRQDVAIKRILLTQFVTELWPSYIEQVSQAIRALNNIDTNVAAIRALLSENGTIYLMIDSMRSHFDNITNGNEQVNIR